MLVNQNIAHNHRFTLIFFVPLVLSRITCQSPPIGPLSPRPGDGSSVEVDGSGVVGDGSPWRVMVLVWWVVVVVR